MTDNVNVTNNADKSQFEVHQDGLTAVLEYQIAGNNIVFSHTEVPDELGGQGIGSALAKTALTFARDEGYTAIPVCPFVVSYIRRHPEWQDIVVGPKK